MQRRKQTELHVHVVISEVMILMQTSLLLKIASRQSILKWWQFCGLLCYTIIIQQIPRICYNKVCRPMQSKCMEC